MNPFEYDLLDLLQMAETPLYSLYRWLEEEVLGTELSMVEFLEMIDSLIERDLVELHHVDWETHVGTVVPAIPAGLMEAYAAHPDLDKVYDPLGYSVALGPAADVRETPDWEIDVDFVARSFVLTAEPDAVAEGFTQIGRLYDAVAFVETGREVVDSRVRVEGVLADKEGAGEGGIGPDPGRLS